MASLNRPETTPTSKPVKDRHLSCGTSSKTFTSLLHQRLHVEKLNHAVPPTQGPICVTFQINLRQQTIHCPLCRHQSKQVKTERGFVTHFNRNHTQYTLRMDYHCSVCNLTLAAEEKQEHLDEHRRQRQPLTPASPPPRSSAESPPSTPANSSPSVECASSLESPSSPPSLNIDLSQPSPDSDNPMTQNAPSPNFLSQTSEDSRTIMSRFLMACREIPPPPPERTEASPSSSPATSDSKNLLTETNLYPNIRSQTPSEIRELSSQLLEAQTSSPLTPGYNREPAIVP